MDVVIGFAERCLGTRSYKLNLSVLGAVYFAKVLNKTKVITMQKHAEKTDACTPPHSINFLSYAPPFVPVGRRGDPCHILER